MKLDGIKAQRAELADAVGTEKLLQEVIRLVEDMNGGVSGLLKQFQYKGLGNVASALAANGPTRTISPAQLVHGLGTETVHALATESGLDVRVVRTKLVEILPRVVRQLMHAETPARVAIPA